MRRALTAGAKRRLVLGVLGSLGVVSATAGLAHAAGIWLNTTDSMPRGFWRETARAARRGDVALLCLPDTPDSVAISPPERARAGWSRC